MMMSITYYYKTSWIIISFHDAAMIKKLPSLQAKMKSPSLPPQS